MAKRVFEELKTNMWFWVLLVFSMAFLTAGLLLPPLGSIDNSVLTGIGELLGFGVIGTVLEAIKAGVDATVNHNGTQITITNDKKEEDAANS